MEGSVSKSSHAQNTRDGLPLCSVEGADSGGNHSPVKQRAVDVAPSPRCLSSVLPSCSPCCSRTI